MRTATSDWEGLVPSLYISTAAKLHVCLRPLQKQYVRLAVPFSPLARSGAEFAVTYAQRICAVSFQSKTLQNKPLFRA